ncbi:MAG: DegV family protein [Firmicutes bacterium]|jgi:DegV family protein with EDD domain|nr:DegV family protein [Bacillota bacterium]
MLQVITDSACDLPQQLAQNHNIDIIPFIVHIDGKEYVDGKTIHSDDVFHALREGKKPTTSQVPARFFWETFTKYAEKGVRCIYVAFSSKLSGTCNTARMVAEEVRLRYPNFQLTICDSLSGSLAQGLIALEAAQLGAAGAEYNEVVERVMLRSDNNVEHIFTVDDLGHLHRGGRIGWASAVMGSVLRVKPILHVLDGQMLLLQKARGKTAALKRIVDVLKERSLGHVEQLIGITHADDGETAEQLKEMLENALGYKHFIVNTIGSVLGCHIGLGGVAAFFVNKKASIPNLPLETV